MRLSNIIKMICGHKQNVLILDDDEDNVELMVNYLHKIRNVKIYKSYNPTDAENKLNMIDFSLIILDIQMPVMDGYELATRIKSGHYKMNKNTPVIFITGVYNSFLNKMKGYNIGSIDYIEKPISQKDFIKSVRKYLNSSDEKGDNDKFFLRERLNNMKKSLKL